MNAALLLFSLFAYCPARDSALSFEAGCLACTADAAASISILQASPRQGHKLVSLGPPLLLPWHPPPPPPHLLKNGVGLSSLSLLALLSLLFSCTQHLGPAIDSWL